MNEKVRECITLCILHHFSLRSWVINKHMISWWILAVVISTGIQIKFGWATGSLVCRVLTSWSLISHCFEFCTIPILPPLINEWIFAFSLPHCNLLTNNIFSNDDVWLTKIGDETQDIKVIFYFVIYFNIQMQM